MMTSLKMRCPCAILLGLLFGFSIWPCAQAQVRKSQLGDKVESFTITDIDGQEFTYEHRRDRVTILTFLRAYHKRSDRALDDLLKLVSDLRQSEHPVDLLIIISGGEGIEYFRKKREVLAIETPMLIDANDVLWGRMGVIVTPTTFLIDKQGAITWIRAGHGYDFATETQTRSGLALGIVGVAETDVGEPVQSLVNDSDEARAKRHLRMGQILARKGEVESGITELKKAMILSPSSVTIRLELVRLLCRTGNAEEALVTVEDITPDSRAEIARLKMLSGWAHRQLGDLEKAIALLTDSIALDPDLDRALFELGKIYERRGEYKQAMETYRRALAIQFDEKVNTP